MTWLRRTLAPHDPRWAAPSPKRVHTPSGRGGSPVDRARRYLERVPPAISGQGGHVRTLLAAEHVVRGFQLDDETALDLLRECNARCVPPWSDGELWHKIHEARERGTSIEMGQHLAKRGAP
jgi:hypothetical protein